MMQKWEYDVVELKVAPGVIQAGKLKEAGDDGWELVSVVYDGSEMRAFFKRPKVESPGEPRIRSL